MITRCICHRVTFEEIKTLAEEKQLSKLEELQKKDICACGCGLCIPYIKMMLETGKTAFEYGVYYDR